METVPASPEIVPAEQAGEATAKSGSDVDRQSPEHRISCHRCGNIRKRRLLCSRKTCPHIFCGRCCDKMKDEYGPDIFVDGCPVCKDMCCCSNKSISCLRINHCYRKCPASKNKAACSAYKEELAHSSSAPENRPPPTFTNDKPNGILDLLAAVADNQLNDQIAVANGKRKFQDTTTCSDCKPAVTATAQPVTVKTEVKTEDIVSNSAFGFENPAQSFAFLPMSAFQPLRTISSESSSSQSAAPTPSGSAAPQYLTSTDLFSPYAGAYAAMMAPNGSMAPLLFPTAAGGYEGLNYLLAPVPIPTGLGLDNRAPSGGGVPAVTPNAAASTPLGSSQPPPMSFFTGAYRPAAPLYVDAAGGGYHLYDMNGIDGFVNARVPASGSSASSSAPAPGGLSHPAYAPIGLAAIPGLQYHPGLQAPMSYAFLTRPMLSAAALTSALPPPTGLSTAQPQSQAQSLTTAATTFCPSVLAQPAAVTTPVSAPAPNTRRIPFAGTEIPAVRPPKSIDITKRPSPPRTSQGGLTDSSTVISNSGRAGDLDAAAASLASTNPSQVYTGTSANPINILALVSSYSSTLGGSGGGANSSQN